MTERERFNPLPFIEAVSLLGIISSFAFTRKTREDVYSRSGGKSEISGVKYTQMEVMHTDHSRDSNYDSPKRGLLVGILEHLIFHRVHKGRAKEIGLTEEQNDNAINLIFGRMRDE